MDNNQKIKLRDEIEKLDKNNHLEILKILKKHNITFSENKNGSFINLNYVNDTILNEIKDYISYVNKQENIISELEIQKEEFVQKFFTCQTPVSVPNSNITPSGFTFPNTSINSSNYSSDNH